MYWDGMVGHSGKNGCHMYCGTLGRRKMQASHYYPALLKPNHCPPGSDHPDIDVFNIPLGGSDGYADNLQYLVSSCSQCQWELRKTETGITKPPLILGLNPKHSLDVLLCMAPDIMHLAANLSELISLWCGTIECAGTDNRNTWDWAVLQSDETWKAHGKAVEDAGIFLPGLFDWKPRNIADKLNTSYKTSEFQLYTFGITPALLYGILPDCYWSNYCKLIHVFHILCQHQITFDELKHAYVLFCTWELKFEKLYY